MKRLIKKSGLGEEYLKTIDSDVVTVYHGTGAQNYYSILDNGLQDGGGVSYQLVTQMTQPGIWVTLKKHIAEGYAIQAAEGYLRDNENDEFSNYGVVFEFLVNKEDLSDEGSGVMHNFKMKVPVTPSMISSGHAYIININDDSQYQAF